MTLTSIERPTKARNREAKDKDSNKLRTPLELYIRDVKLAGELLTAEQEKQLGREIQREKASIREILFRSPIVQRYAIGRVVESDAGSRQETLLDTDGENIVKTMTELTQRIAAQGRKPGSDLRATTEKLLDSFEDTLLEARKELFKSVETFSSATKLAGAAGVEILSSDLSDRAINQRFASSGDILLEIEHSRAKLAEWRTKFQDEPAQLLTSLDLISSHRAQRHALLGQFVKRNLRLVISIAKGYLGRGADLLDLIGAGNTGAFDAADRFDPEWGARFSTFASDWIKRAISAHLMDTANTIRHPRYMHQQENLYRRAQTSLVSSSESSRPNHDEIRAQMNSLKGEKQKAVSIKTVLACESLPSAYAFSQNGTHNGEEDSELPYGDLAAAAPHSLLTSSSQMSVVAGIIGTLNPLCTRIVLARLAQSKVDEETLESIGKDFVGDKGKPLCKERVRQIEKALKQIFSAISTLEEYPPARRAAAMQALRVDLTLENDKDPLLPIKMLIGEDGKLVTNEFLNESFPNLKYNSEGFILSPEKTALVLSQLLLKLK